VTTVSAGYFQTIRQPLIQGRTFDEHDDAKALPVALINQTMARHRWPSEDPIGKRVTFDHGQRWITIVGVAGAAKEFGLGRPVGDEIYTPLAQNGVRRQPGRAHGGRPVPLHCGLRQDPCRHHNRANRLSLTLGPRCFRSETFIDGRQSPGGFSIRDPARGGGQTLCDKNDPAETLEENASLPF
jgi:hypothetical protein